MNIIAILGGEEFQPDDDKAEPPVRPQGYTDTEWEAALAVAVRVGYPPLGAYVSSKNKAAQKCDVK